MNTFRRTPGLALALLVSSALLALPVAHGAPTPSVAPTGPSDFIVPSTAGAKPCSPTGFLQRWLVLDPINATGVTQNAVQAAVKKEYFPNQFTVIPHDGDKVTVNDVPLTWHALDTKFHNLSLYHFGLMYKVSTANALMWVVTIVNSPEEVPNARLAIGSNDASVWWVNGKEVIGIYGDRLTIVDDGVSKRLTLKKGPNVVRAGIHNQGGNTDFCARFLDANDQPITNLTVDLSTPVP